MFEKKIWGKNIRKKRLEHKNVIEKKCCKKIEIKRISKKLF